MEVVELHELYRKKYQQYRKNTISINLDCVKIWDPPWDIQMDEKLPPHPLDVAKSNLAKIKLTFTLNDAYG